MGMEREKLVAALMLTSVAASAFGNEAHEMLSRHTEPNQRYALAKIIRSAGDACPSATRVFYQGMERRTRVAMWNAECSNGRSYVISIYPDGHGSTKVLECKVLKAVAGVDCFRPFK